MKLSRRHVLFSLLAFDTAVCANELQDSDSLKAMPVDKIVEKSWKSVSQVEKRILRSYLAKTYPTTVQGIWAAAWLAEAYNEPDKAKSLIAQGLIKDPNYLRLLSLEASTASCTKSRRLELYAKILAVDATFFNFDIVRLNYFALAESNTAQAITFLSSIEGKYPESYISSYIRARIKRSEGDKKETERLFEAAITKNDVPFDAVETYSRFGLFELTTANSKESDRLKYVQAVTAFIERRTERARRTNTVDPVLNSAYLYMADLFRTEFKNEKLAFELCRKAFHTYPTAEAAQQAYSTGLADFREESEQYLLFANKTLPGNYSILKTLAEHFMELDSVRSVKFAEQAIAASPNDYEVVDASLVLASSLEADLQAERAFQTAENVKLLVKQKTPSVRTYIYNNRFRVGQYRVALQTLAEDKKGLSTTNNAYFVPRCAAAYKLLGEVSRLNASRSADGAARAFSAFVNGNVLKVRFQAGSSLIKADDDLKLHQLIEVMKPFVGIEWQFSLSSHSKVSATAIQRLDVVRSLLEPAFGERKLLVENSAIGSTGDYVEIRINLVDKQPHLVANGTYTQTDKMVLSPCGRWLVTGIPLTVIDTANGKSVTTLGLYGSSLQFSPNGKYLALGYVSTTTVGNFPLYLRRVYECTTWKVIYSDEGHVDNASLDWHPDSRLVAFCNSAGSVDIIDADLRKIVKRKRLNNRRLFTHVMWSADRKYLISAAAQDNVVKVWDATSLNLVRTLSGVDWPHSIGQSLDFRYLLCNDNTRTLTIWDTTTWAISSQRKCLQINQPRVPLPMHPDGKTFILGDSFGGANAKPAIVDIATGKEILALVSPGRSSAYVYTPDGAYFLEGSYSARAVHVRSNATTEIVNSFVPKVNELITAYVDDSSGYFVCLDAEGIHVFDIATASQIHTWANIYGLRYVYTPNGQKKLFALRVEDKNTTVYAVDFVSFTLQSLVTVPGRNLTLCYVDNWFVVGSSKQTDSGQMEAPDGSISIFDAADFSLVSSFELPLATEYLVYQGLYYAGWTAIIPGKQPGTVFVTSYWQDGYGHGRTYGKQIRTVDLKSGEVIRTKRYNDAIQDLFLEPASGDAIVVISNVEQYTGVDLNFVKYLPYVSGQRAISLSDGKVLVWGETQIWLLQRDEQITSQAPVIEVTGLLVRVHAIETDNLIITADHTNTIRYYTFVDFKLILTIINQTDNEWVAFTPEGEYSSSLRGSDCLGIVVGGRQLPIETFRGKLAKPLLIAEKIRATKQNRTVATAPLVLPENVFGDLYKATVTSSVDVTTTEASYVLRVKVTKLRSDSPEPILVVSTQGRGINLEPKKEGSEHIQTVALVEGLNKIEFGFRVNGVVIQKQSVDVIREKTAATSANVDLWFLGIGINDYKGDDFDLAFATKDVQELEKVILAQKGPLYRNVHTKVLVNSSATNQEVKLALREFLGLAGSNDVIIVYIAGHGVMDTDQTLYFMTHDSDLTKPYSGTNLEDFNRILQARPISQKAVFLMDICHAGAFGTGGRRRGGLTVEDAVKQLQDGTGTVVLASSTGRESSLEDPSFGGGHGAFTASILELIRQKPNSAPSPDANDLAIDKFITVSDLQNYVMRRVPKITGGKQHPTTPKIDQLRNFPLLMTVTNP